MCQTRRRGRTTQGVVMSDLQARLSQGQHPPSRADSRDFFAFLFAGVSLRVSRLVLTEESVADPLRLTQWESLNERMKHERMK